MLEGLIGGLSTVLQPINLIAMILAVFLGFIGGAMPGISGAMLIIIILPLSYGMDPIMAFIIMTSIYAVTSYSGMISAILFRIPGTPEAVATVFDGYPMAQKGQAGRAMGIATLSSSMGGIIGALVLILLTPLLSSVALKFSAPEYFALAILALTVVTSLSTGDMARGLIGVAFGLFLATVGIDHITGTPRFNFGLPSMMSGINFLPILIGLFAISEVIKKAEEEEGIAIKEKIEKVKTKIFEIEIIKDIYTTIMRSSIIGVIIGILPGVGASTAALLSYSEAVRWSKNPKEFGTGIPKGIAAPETANNAAAMGALVPLLSLGIPGSATTALILGAFMLHGLQPGPLLLVQQPTLVYSIFVCLLVVNLSLLVFAKPFIALFSSLIFNVPFKYMGPVITVLCIIGTYAVRNSIFDLWIMFAFGIIGYWFSKIKFPVATVILGVVLGPIAEQEFRRSLVMSSGDFTIFFTRPISAVLLICAVLSLLLPLVKGGVKKMRKNASAKSA